MTWLRDVVYKLNRTGPRTDPCGTPNERCLTLSRPPYSLALLTLSRPPYSLTSLLSRPPFSIAFLTLSPLLTLSRPPYSLVLLTLSPSLLSHPPFSLALLILSPSLLSRPPYYSLQRNILYSFLNTALPRT